MSVIEQSFEPVVLVAPAQTTHGPRAHAQDLGHVDPRLTLLESVQQDVGNLHGPLHCSPGVGHRHLPGGHDSPAACVERSDHLLSGADKSCTPDIAGEVSLSLTSDLAARV